MFNKLTSRYIIPFSYDVKKTGFSSLHEASNGLWNLDDYNTSERDIYDFISQALITNNSKFAPSASLGCNYNANSFSHKLVYIDAKDDFEIPFQINDVHLVLFKNGIGFLWYEIAIHNKKNDYDTTVLTKMNYHIKELARSERTNRIFTEEGNAPISLADNGSVPKYARIIKDKYIERKPFFLGEWVSDILASLNTTISFYPSRKLHSKESLIPDKALMFHHLATDDRDSIINTAFYLSRGYKDTYQMPLSIESEMFRPFENIYIYATIEGCGYYAYCDEKSTFILDPTKIMSDYFTLYILLLYQSYSALLYSEMIAEHLSSDKDGYEKFSSTAMEHIENLSLEIDVFLAKSIYTSVSHVQHQNDFYHYVEKRFRINENYTNLQSSIKSLHSLETKLNESENQRKRNYIEIGVTLLSLMAIISVFDDANDLAVSFLSEIFGFSISGSLIVMNSIVGVVSIIVLGLCFAFFVSNVKSSKLFTKKKEKR